MRKEIVFDASRDTKQGKEQKVRFLRHMIFYYGTSDTKQIEYV